MSKRPVAMPAKQSSRLDSSSDEAPIAAGRPDQGLDERRRREEEARARERERKYREEKLKKRLEKAARADRLSDDERRRMLKKQKRMREE